MEVLKKAVAAKIPLIAVTTSDITNASDVIAHITGMKAVPMGQTPKKGTIQLQMGAKVNDAFVAEHYNDFLAAESSLILINPTSRNNVFDAGVLPTPPAMLKAFLMEMVDDEEEAKLLASALGGCTLREADEISRLTMAETGAFTAKGIGKVRRGVFQGQKGLTPVDTYQVYYEPNAHLAAYVAREKDFFFDAPRIEFQPRGLLMDGPPGTGKSSGAKFLADQWGVPLFRLSLGDTKDKFVGESQKFLDQALASLDAQEPCIVLVDEVEKALGHAEFDGGTTTDMLGSLLWWLQEHKTRVLTVMTTNNRKIIPPELYRPGRIDEVVWVGGLDQEQAVQFVMHYVKALKVKVPKGTKINATAIVKQAFDTGKLPEGTVSHSSLQQETIKAIKYASKG